MWEAQPTTETSPIKNTNPLMVSLHHEELEWPSNPCFIVQATSNRQQQNKSQARMVLTITPVISNTRIENATVLSNLKWCHVGRLFLRNHH